MIITIKTKEKHIIYGILTKLSLNFEPEFLNLNKNIYFITVMYLTIFSEYTYIYLKKRYLKVIKM